MSDCGGDDHCQRDELLARVEALREALNSILSLANGFYDQDQPRDGKGPFLAALTIARAALACPPQQRGEK